MHVGVMHRTRRSLYMTDNLRPGRTVPNSKTFLLFNGLLYLYLIDVGGVRLRDGCTLDESLQKMFSNITFLWKVFDT